MDKNIWMSILRALENKKMSQKKKTILIVGVILFVVMGLIGKYQYDQYQVERNRHFSKMALLFMVLQPEDKNLIKNSYSNLELTAFQKNPPKIEMNTSAGLGIKVLAYNYYNDENIDATKIQEMMENGEFNSAYEDNVDFIYWSNHNRDDITDYQNAIQKAAERMGTHLPAAENTTYQDYLNIINNPEGKIYMDEFYTSIEKNNE